MLKMFRQIGKRLRRWAQKKTQKHLDVNKMQQELDIRAKEKQELEMMETLEERDVLLNRVEELEANLAFERNKTDQDSVKAELEKERFTSLLRHHEQEKNMIMLDMEERNATYVQNITELQTLLLLCEERKKTAELVGQSLMENQEQLEKNVAQLKTTLASERKHHEQEKNQLKLEHKKMTTALLVNITKIQASMKICEEKQKIIEVNDERRMRAQEQVQKAVQLKATLASEQGQLEQEKETILLDMEEGNAEHLKKIAKIHSLLKLYEELEKTTKLESEFLMKDRARLDKRVAQLEAIITSERRQHEQEKEKIKLENKEMTLTLLQKITNLQASMTLTL